MSDPSPPAASSSRWSPARWSRKARWAAPVGVVTALATVVVVVPVLATASPALPSRTAAELLVGLSEAELQPMSGTVVQTARLGLPELPAAPGGGSLAALAPGSHTVRVWYGGPDQVRLALIGSLAETDVLRSGEDAWLWTSATNTAEHLTLPEDAGVHEDTPSPAAGSGLTPREAAERALALIDPTTEVSVDGTTEVAGRPVYSLLLRPRDEGSLVSQVRVGVDSETSVPLQVQVLAKGVAEPVFETGFTAVTFENPADSVFAFTPPPGATVKERALPEGMSGGRGADGSAKESMDPPDAMPDGLSGTPRPDAGLAGSGGPTVVGSGWTSVAVLRRAAGPPDVQSATDESTDAQLAALLQAAEPVSGSYGSGRLLRTALVSVLLLDDGRVLVGAVTPAVLEAAASDPAAASAEDSAAARAHDPAADS
jgi:outer membrane lipoprotein-sorting protein